MIDLWNMLQPGAKLLALVVASWLVLISGAVLIFYSGAGVAMVFGLLRGSPWSQFFLVRLGFWSAIFLPALIILRLVR